MGDEVPYHVSLSGVLNPENMTGLRINDDRCVLIAVMELPPVNTRIAGHPQALRLRFCVLSSRGHVFKSHRVAAVQVPGSPALRACPMAV